jgi:hypothetical protein
MEMVKSFTDQNIRMIVAPREEGGDLTCLQTYKDRIPEAYRPYCIEITGFRFDMSSSEIRSKLSQPL